MSTDITANGDPKAPAAPASGPLPAAPRHPQPLDEHDLPKNLKSAHPALIAGMLLLFLLLVAALFVLGWIPHQHAAEQAASDASARSDEIPIVIVAQPRLANSAQDVNLPCDLRANAQTAVYARASGYLQSFTHDIGSAVEEGETLARIAAPDVDAQLQQSQAALKQAQANREKAVADLNYAKRTLDRYKAQAASGVVGVQEMDDRQSAADQAQAALDVANASINSAEADIKRFTVLQEFEIIKSPFKGIIIARNYDVGALISPGSSMEAHPLFTIAQINILRALINVPQVYAARIAQGQPAAISVRNFPGLDFQGTVARNSRAISDSSRTILFEIDVPNTDAKHPLFPGMYGTAILRVTQERPDLVIDSSALIFNAKGSQVAIVRDGTIHFQSISVDRDLGPELEVTGISPDDGIVVNPGQRLAEGIKVEVRSRTSKSAPAVAADAH